MSFLKAAWLASAALSSALALTAPAEAHIMVKHAHHHKLKHHHAAWKTHRHQALHGVSLASIRAAHAVPIPPERAQDPAAPQFFSPELANLTHLGQAFVNDLAAVFSGLQPAPAALPQPPAARPVPPPIAVHFVRSDMEPFDPLGTRLIERSVRTAVKSGFWRTGNDALDNALRVASAFERVDAGLLFGTVHSESGASPELAKKSRTKHHGACGVGQEIPPPESDKTANSPLTEDLYRTGPRYGFNGPDYIARSLDKKGNLQYTLKDSKHWQLAIDACEDVKIGAGLTAAHLHHTHNDIMEWTGRYDREPVPAEDYGGHITGALGSRDMVLAHGDPVKGKEPVTKYVALRTAHSNINIFFKDATCERTVHIPRHGKVAAHTVIREAVVKQPRSVDETYDYLAVRITGFFNGRAFAVAQMPVPRDLQTSLPGMAL